MKFTATTAALVLAFTAAHAAPLPVPEQRNGTTVPPLGAVSAPPRFRIGTVVRPDGLGGFSDVKIPIHKDFHPDVNAAADHEALSARAKLPSILGGGLGGKAKETDASQPPRGQTSQYQQGGTVGYAGHDGPIPSDRKPPSYGSASRDKPPAAGPPPNVFNQPVSIPGWADKDPRYQGNPFGGASSSGGGGSVGGAGSAGPAASKRRLPSLLGGLAGKGGKETDASKPPKGQTSQYQQTGTVAYSGYDGVVPSDKKPPSYSAAAKDQPPAAGPPPNVFNRPVQLPPSRPGSGSGNANPVAPWESQGGPSSSSRRFISWA